MFSFIHERYSPQHAPDSVEDYDPLIVAVMRQVSGEGTPQEAAALFEQLQCDPVAAGIAWQIIHDEATLRAYFALGSQKPEPGSNRPEGETGQRSAGAKARQGSA